MRVDRWRECALTVCLVLSLAPAFGDSGEESLVTDRPDFTESSLVLPAGRVQLEWGFTWSRQEGGADGLEAPELLARWGVARRVELRLAAPVYAWSSEEAMESGFSDIAMGLRYQLGPLAGWDLSVIGMLSLPTGELELSSEGVDPELVLTWSRELSDRFSLSGQWAGNWPTVDDSRQFQWSTSLSLGMAIASRWGTFLEVQAEVPEDGGTAAVLHHGYTCRFGNNFQIDFHGAVGLNRSAPDFLLGGGAAWRF